ncbi:MAG: MBL fold metallo-hydrolase [Vicinamibacterales bacterium]
MTVLSAGVRYIDLQFRRSRVIATGVIDGPGGVALVDPGPSSSLPALEKGLGGMGMQLADVTTVLLTHIHLDHAGVTGTLVRRQPGISVYVHEIGARHLVDPAKLIASASRIYGDQMNVLWGECAPVPSANLVTLRGGESLSVAGRRFDVAYTPGHASHHVSYFDGATGLVWVGDACGARIGSSSFVMPTTPPPDIDLEIWSQSLDRILAWSPATLFLTHFGPSEHPQTHVAELRERLSWAASMVREALAAFPGADGEPQASARAQRELALELRRHMSEGEATTYEAAVPLEHCYQGLARYWRKSR